MTHLTRVARDRGVGQAVRWGAKSVGTLALNMALLVVWVEWVGIPAELAIVPNLILVPAVGYAITDVWVFADEPSASSWRGHLSRYVGMHLANGTAKVGNYIIYVALLQLGVWYVAAWVAGAVTMFVVSFGANRRLWRSEIGR